MHIGPKGIVRRSIMASYCGYHWCMALNGPGCIVACKDGGTLWLQGDCVSVLERQLEDACLADTTDDELEAVDRVLSQYVGALDNDPACGPSSDLMLVYYYYDS